jgi:hypothetical protein
MFRSYDHLEEKQNSIQYLIRFGIGLSYQPQMMDDDESGAVGGMSGLGNQNTRRKPAPVPLRPPQIPHDVT